MQYPHQTTPIPRNMEGYWKSDGSSSTTGAWLLGHTLTSQVSTGDNFKAMGEDGSFTVYNYNGFASYAPGGAFLASVTEGNAVFKTATIYDGTYEVFNSENKELTSYNNVLGYNVASLQWGLTDNSVGWQHCVRIEALLDGSNNFALLPTNRWFYGTSGNITGDWAKSDPGDSLTQRFFFPNGIADSDGYMSIHPAIRQANNESGSSMFAWYGSQIQFFAPVYFSTGFSTYYESTIANTLYLANGSFVDSSGFLKLTDGSAGSPSHTFANSTGTGFFLNAVNQIGVSSGGTTRMFIGNSSITATVAMEFISGAVNALGLRLSNDTNTGFYGNGSDLLAMVSGGVQKFRIDPNGCYGSHTDSGTTTALAVMTIERRSSGTAAAGLGAAYAFNLQAADGVIYGAGSIASRWVDAGTAKTTAIVFSTRAGERLRVDDTKATVTGSLKITALPTSTTGLTTGDIWNDAGTLKVV